MSRLQTQRIAFALCCLVLAAASAVAQPVPRPQPAPRPQPRPSVPAQPQAQPKPTSEKISADEQLLRQAVQKFVEHYNAHQAKELTALFAADARMVFRDGSEVNGHEEIQQTFIDDFAANPKAALSVVVHSIRFLTPDVAVEEGTTTLFPDGETLAARSHYTVLHLKREGRWQMQSVRTVEEESLSAYGDLRNLEWLVGEWIDEGRSDIVESKFRWDENKSFLLEEFQVVREGVVILKGTQRIGWDPQAKTIRSWVFDSAGGFGEAVWTAVEDAWVVKFKAVLADGSSASATRTLARAAKDRVIWSAVDRISGGELLPDLMVTMVRKPPQAP